MVDRTVSVDPPAIADQIFGKENSVGHRSNPDGIALRCMNCVWNLLTQLLKSGNFRFSNTLSILYRVCITTGSLYTL